ncbi:hypothetical protein LOOC260_120590 [Paucilactobacillus hokkaidonensis JCM 18461]|uniref:Uncharacterized protein n=1 Tax=Paucilactobacillus hokkaidonensis JCM 18461 TaxID=1291742 RepID=A0A0A1GWX3_9LACO|nr:hypothetical protein [Paucilactobacillus hokkaidonensis]BAP86565.1 hypothetical protein LOOC260_120590 [Paucilactobacillus hokkaidonensis JCM 18461]
MASKYLQANDEVTPEIQTIIDGAVAGTTKMIKSKNTDALFSDLDI